MYVYTLYILYLRVLACICELNKLLEPIAGEAAGTIGGLSCVLSICIYNVCMYAYPCMYI